MEKTLLAYAMVKMATGTPYQKSLLPLMVDPSTGAALGALGGGGLGLLTQLVRGHNNKANEDKPSLLRGALVGALLGGGLGYGVAGDAFRTTNFDTMLTDPGYNAPGARAARTAMLENKPSFWEALPHTMTPGLSKEQRLDGIGALIEQRLKTVRPNLQDEIRQDFLRGMLGQPQQR